VSAAIVADTGGLLKALARTTDGRPSFPEFARALTSASLVIVPALVLAERLRVLRVLTTDHRDFGTVRLGPRLAQPLELVP
jgi:hypothetical protein